MAWYCMHDNTPADPKWIVIAKRSGQPKVAVLALWLALLDYANQQPKRGSLDGIDCEVLDAMLDLDDGTSQAIIQAMTDKGLIADGKIVNWDKRQLAPKETGAKSATQRSRDFRERKRNADATDMQRDATECNANVTPCNASATECNGDATDATAIKRNKIKEKDINPPVIPPCDEPGIEFMELRQIWDEHVKPEGERAGFKEYLALKSQKRWPGLARIRDDILKRKEAGYWRPGFEPGLKLYLERLDWTAPVEAARWPGSFEDEEERRRRGIFERAAQRERERAEAQARASEENAA